MVGRAYEHCWGSRRRHGAGYLCVLCVFFIMLNTRGMRFTGRTRAFNLRSSSLSTITPQLRRCSIGRVPVLFFRPRATGIQLVSTVRRPPFRCVCVWLDDCFCAAKRKRVARAQRNHVAKALNVAKYRKMSMVEVICAFFAVDYLWIFVKYPLGHVFSRKSLTLHYMRHLVVVPLGCWQHHTGGLF